VKVLVAIDATLDRVLERVTRFYCWLTGRSNFTLAWWTLHLGIFGVITQNCYDMITDPSVINFVFLLLMYVHLKVLFSYLRPFYKQLQEQEESGQRDVLKLDPALLTAYAFIRWVVLFLLWPPHIFTSLGSFSHTLFLFSMHFVLHFNGGGKSVVRRTVDALKKAGSWLVGKVKDLIPQPMPAPSPVRI
jgi:hypothetical protein